MKTKRAFLALTITALILTVILISLEAYYVAIALVVGTLLMGYREIWSLLKRRKMPPIDERVRENTNKAIRNGFIFFAVVCALLMVPFSMANLFENPSIVQVVGGLFVSVGVVYLLSYLFYERAEPRLGDKGMKMLRIFLLVAGISLAVAIISIFLHNAIYGVFIHFFGADFWDRTGLNDEPVFFFIGLFAALVALPVGILGSLGMFIKGLVSRSRE